MKTCTQCPKPLPETSHMTECAVCRRRMRRAAVAKGEIPPPATERVRDVEMTREDQIAAIMIVRGHLPDAFTLDAFTGKPLWSVHNLAAMFDMAPGDFLDMMAKRGPVYLEAGSIPSSWKLLEGASV